MCILFTPRSSKFVVGAFLLDLDFRPLLRAESLQWEEMANQVFLREREGGVRVFAPWGYVFTESQGGSIFEVSELEGPAFTSIPPVTPPFPVAVDQCISLEANTIQQAVYLSFIIHVFSATSVVGVTTLFSPSSTPVLANRRRYRTRA